jgi:DNA polymerase III epsilon subunit-like protein
MRKNLLRFNKQQKYVFFDFETCGLNLGSLRNKPWQLAFIVINDDRIIEKKDYWLKWDDLKVSEGAAKVTGWTQKKHDEKAVDPLQPIQHFEKYLYDPEYLKVGHNILGFDVYMHGICRRLLNQKPDYSYLSQLIDTLSLSRAINENIALQSSDNLLQWQYKILSLKRSKGKNKLIDLCKKYDIRFNAAKLHDALYDIEKNYEVFKKLIWNIEI